MSVPARKDLITFVVLIAGVVGLVTCERMVYPALGAGVEALARIPFNAPTLIPGPPGAFPRGVEGLQVKPPMYKESYFPARREQC
jgi:hypothetical protein